MKGRDRHKSIGNEDEYKTWRNKVIKLINISKKAQYQRSIDNNKDNPSSIYEIFKKVGAENSLLQHLLNLVILVFFLSKFSLVFSISFQNSS